MPKTIFHKYDTSNQELTIIILGTENDVKMALMEVKAAFSVYYKADSNQPMIPSGSGYVAILTYYKIPEPMVDMLLGKFI